MILKQHITTNRTLFGKQLQLNHLIYFLCMHEYLRVSFSWEKCNSVLEYEFDLIT